MNLELTEEHPVISNPEVIKPEYVWPQATEDQKERVHAGGEAPVRVVKTTPTNVKKRFSVLANGDKQVNIGQHRVPLADQSFDMDRLFLELRREGQSLLEEVFPEAPKYCELNDCWKPASDGAFCTNWHRDLAFTAHDRMVKFS